MGAGRFWANVPMPDGPRQSLAPSSTQSRAKSFVHLFKGGRGAGVSVCQWQTSCEPTEPAGETRAPAALPLTLKGRRAKEKGEAVRGSTPSVRPWHQPAPPTIPSSANPLTWESAAFPSHGELRTGLPKRGGPKRCCKMPLTARPFPQSQQPWMGTPSLPTPVRSVRLSESCCVLRLGGGAAFCL